MFNLPIGTSITTSALKCDTSVHQGCVPFLCIIRVELWCGISEISENARRRPAQETNGKCNQLRTIKPKLRSVIRKSVARIVLSLRRNRSFDHTLLDPANTWLVYTIHGRAEKVRTFQAKWHRCSDPLARTFCSLDRRRRTLRGCQFASVLRSG